MKKLLFALVWSGLSLCVARASTDYPPAIYREAYPGHWYTSGYGHKFAVIHDMEGYYLSTISYFQKECQSQNADGSCRGRASAHYCVNGLKDNSTDAARGEVTQMVREAYYSWHATCWNQHSIGTEHEGFASNPAWYTEEMYQASGALQRHLADKFGFPKDRNHIVGHDEKKNSAWVTWARTNLGIDPTCNTHTDPGVNWNWTRFMQIIVGGPAAPTGLALTPLSTTQIKLSWTDNATNETGFKIERATSASGPWTQITTVAANITTYTNGGLTASTVYYYQVRAYNADGDSDYTPVKSATTGNAAPVLSAIGNKSVNEGSLLTFTAKATDAGLGATTVLTDFESFSSGATSILFQKPGYSGSSRGVSTAATNYTAVTSSFPAGSGKGSRVLKASWTFDAGSSNWVRLTTASASSLPRPVIDLRQILKFDIYTDTALKIGLCASETGNPAGTAIGSDGGSSTSYEWVGVTNVNSVAPMPTRTIPANTWTTVQFNLPFEPVTPFALADANGILSTPTGLGAIEHLALVPVSTASGTYTIHMDNFAVVYSNLFTFSLDAGAPAGATIDPYTGVFKWTPTEAQSPGVYDITIRVTDKGNPPLSDFETITVVVNEVNNGAPTLAAISNRVVLAGDTLTFTNSATDVDVPLDLSFNLAPGAPFDAFIDPVTGVFTWPTAPDAPDSTNSITVVVSDNGTPELTASQTFSVRVVSRVVTVANSGNGSLNFTWSTVPGRKYRLQFKNALSDANWVDATGDITATQATFSQNVAASSAQGFYRVIQLP